MPKNLVKVVRNELAKRNVELLDVYSFRDHDVIRVFNKQSGKVVFYKSSRKVNTLTTREEIENLVLNITKQV